MTHPKNALLRRLYLELKPYASAFIGAPILGNSPAHRIYFECSSNPNSLAVTYLYGGPGAACRPVHRRYFDPEKYHIILFDQRGCGRSTPLGQLADNTAQTLIADMEKIRQQLNLQKWLLFGGSWGSHCIMRDNTQAEY